MSLPRAEELKWLLDLAKETAAVKESHSVQLAHLVDALIREYPTFLEARLSNDYNEQFRSQFWASLGESMPREHGGNTPKKRLSPEARALITSAERIARTMQHRMLDVGHIAIACLQRKSVHKMLRQAGVSTRELREAWENCHQQMTGMNPRDSESFRQRRRIFLAHMSPEQQSLLAAGGVPFARGRLAGIPGVFIHEMNQHPAAQVLDAKFFAVFDTKYRWLQQAVLRPDWEPAGYERGLRVNFNRNRRTHVEDRVHQLVHETIQPMLGVNVEIVNARGECQEPERHDGFRVILYSSAVDERELAPHTLFGIETDKRLPFFKPSGRGTVLQDDTGAAYGELIDNNLYLFFPVDLEEGDRERQIGMFALAADAFAARPLDETPEGSEFANAGHKLTHHGLFCASGTMAIALAREILTRGIDCSVHLKNCNGEEQERIDDGKFYVFYNARTPQLVPKGTGVPVLLEGDEVAAELFGANLYIYGEPFVNMTTRESSRYSTILHAAKEQFGVHRGLVTPTMVAHQYAAECIKHLKKCGEEPIRGGGPAVPVQQAESRLAELSQNAQRIERRMLNLDSEAEEMLGREFDALSTMEQVLDVTVEEDEVVVQTDVIYCTNPKTGWRHRLGRFEIRLQLTEPYSVRFLNEDPIHHEGHVRHAPHVINDGEPCLGNVQDLFPQMLATRNLTQAVQIAIAYLEWVNPDDPWGRSISQWPVERA